MTRRRMGPIYDFWHPRVEGQIRHTMNVHPEWFSFATPHAKDDCVNSLAKRIVGEIVAGTDVAPVAPKSVITDGGAGSTGGVEHAGARPRGWLQTAFRSVIPKRLHKRRS